MTGEQGGKGPKRPENVCEEELQYWCGVCEERVCVELEELGLEYPDDFWLCAKAYKKVVRAAKQRPDVLECRFAKAIMTNSKIAVAVHYPEEVDWIINSIGRYTEDETRRLAKMWIKAAGVALQEIEEIVRLKPDDLKFRWGKVEILTAMYELTLCKGGVCKIKDRKMPVYLRGLPTSGRLSYGLAIPSIALPEPARKYLEDVESELQEIIRLGPGSYEAHALRGLVLELLGRYADAVKEYDYAIGALREELKRIKADFFKQVKDQALFEDVDDVQDDQRDMLSPSQEIELRLRNLNALMTECVERKTEVLERLNR